MYERLPTPYGLVRYGVAPDHPEVKVREYVSRLNAHSILLFSGGKLTSGSELPA